MSSICPKQFFSNQASISKKIHKILVFSATEGGLIHDDTTWPFSQGQSLAHRNEQIEGNPTLKKQAAD
jgi:hypothetical protein